MNDKISDSVLSGHIHILVVIFLKDNHIEYQYVRSVLMTGYEKGEGSRIGAVCARG